MEEEFAGAFGVIVFWPGVFVGEDSGIDEEGFMVDDADVACREVGMAEADGFDFGSKERDSGF